jgi:uncharacterized OB-fold protein
MTDARVPSPAPDVIAEAKPYWDGAADGRLVLPKCSGCDEVIWHPRTWCPSCGRAGVTWIEASGRGTVYSHTTVRRGGPPAYADAMPYVVAYVELDEGPRVLTNIHTDDPDGVRIGQVVEAVFDPVEGTALTRFRVLEGQDHDG